MPEPGRGPPPQREGADLFSAKLRFVSAICFSKVVNLLSVILIICCRVIGTPFLPAGAEPPAGDGATPELNAGTSLGAPGVGDWAIQLFSFLRLT